MKKILIMLSALGLTACSNTVPDIENLGDVKLKMKDAAYIDTHGIQSIKLKTAEDKLSFQEYYDKYCLGKEAKHENCIIVHDLIKTKKSYAVYGIK